MSPAPCGLIPFSPMDPALQHFIHELATARIVALFDPNPINWTAQHERDVRRVRRAIGTATDQTLAKFKTPVNRNGFLLGCLDLTEHEPIEHLIVGYGLRSGSTTKIHSVHHAVGTAHQVQLSDAIVSELARHSAADSRGEAVIFHNHPRNDLNHLFDNIPLASNTDRKTLENMALNLVQICRRLSGAGRVLFYLGENGFVREFRWPRLVTILNAAGVILRR
jgi:hypothetical protein